MANAGEDTVTPIRIATNTALKAISLGNIQNTPVDIAITPNSRTAYALTFHAVIPINTVTNTAGKPIKIPGFNS